jgi:CDP-diacylglycerol--serine O-phosphatidyltransferase
MPQPPNPFAPPQRSAPTWDDNQETPSPGGIPLRPADLEALLTPERFLEALLQGIAQARTRITLAALYLQDDTAGREVLEALHQAKRLRPELEVRVVVDWHRARRGRIGEGASEGHAGFYREVTGRLGEGVPIFGVPIQSRELLGVFHLKGFIFDDRVLYSGASINDVYTARLGPYRLDRYHLIHSAQLANAMDGFITDLLVKDPAVTRLDLPETPFPFGRNASIRRLRAALRKASYLFPAPLEEPALAVTPLVGLGSRDNALNRALVDLVGSAQQSLVILTPYFNLPRAIRSSVSGLLQRGVEVRIVLGAKEANDFYIPSPEAFTTIGLLPYLYEANLRRFARTHQAAIEANLLHLHLWRDGANTYHAKGLFVDGHTSVLTGNNLNPRAWALDLENALVLWDREEVLRAGHSLELEHLLQHAPRLGHYRELQAVADYPAEVQPLMKGLKWVRADRLLNRVL